MTLIVAFITKDKSFEKYELVKHIPEPRNEMFGFEVWRKDVWGHPLLAKLGCKLLITLREHDIYAYDEDLLTLKTELKIILQNLELIGSETKAGAEGIEFRTRNALAYIDVALKNGDTTGVYLG